MIVSKICGGAGFWHNQDWLSPQLKGMTWYASYDIANQIDKLIVEAIQHKGFSVVEILDDCPTTYGRRNKYKSVIEMMNRLKEVAVPVKAAEKMTAEQLQGKV